MVAGLLFVGGAVQSQPLLDPLSLVKYLDPLPNPMDNVLSPTGTLNGMDYYEVSVTQFTQQLHGQLSPTTLWGYNGTYPGPTFEVQRNDPIKVKWVNDLRDSNGIPLDHFLPYDTTTHGAESSFPQARIVSHLHGGVVEPESDGFPEHWFSADPNAPNNGLGGPSSNSALYTYHNGQPSSTLWYHDHAMGITRLNVYAGLAGFYLLRDEAEAALNLPGGDYEIPLVFQDRKFYADGQLFYPRGPGDLDPGVSDPLDGLDLNVFPSSASVVPHFLGDVNLVNGKIWPYLEVEPRKYRFRMVNGANSRFYDLQLDAGVSGTLPFYQIGSDGGLLESTVNRSQVLMAPAERIDVVVDFSSLDPSSEVILRNFGPDGPFESSTAGHTPADPDTTGQLMKFRVVPLTQTDTSSLPTSLVAVDRIPESEAVVTRQLDLVEEVDEYGRPKLLLDGAKWTDPTTELPLQGTTEIWEIRNNTVDAHPIHLHLVQFQVLDRMVRPAGGGDPNTSVPEDYELGWKDTVLVNRRETVRVIAKFEDFDGLYVWHCHLLEHEDHEMMRVYEVVPGPELIVEQGATLNLSDPHTTPDGYIVTVDGTLSAVSLSIDGYLRGTGELRSNVTVRGYVSPGGEALGSLTIAGHLELLAASELTIELSGTGDGQFDRVGITGTAGLNGLLDVGLTGGTTLMLGDKFEIVTSSGALTGAFAETSFPYLGSVMKMDVFYDSNSVLLAVVPKLPGDFDLDGDVDATDFLKWQRGESTFPWSSSDLHDWETYYGQSWALEGAAAVPEPGAAALLVMGLLGFSCWGVRRRRWDARHRGTRSITDAEADGEVDSPSMRTRMTTVAGWLSGAVVMFVATTAHATTIVLNPSQDNTLFEDPNGSLSNGAGEHMFAGLTDNLDLRRAVLAFDLSSIPSNSTIESATLTLNMSRTKSNAVSVNLHRLLTDWGEGNSDAAGEEGAGAAADGDPNHPDATWLHTAYPSSTWSSPGGDFDPNASASATVNRNGSYDWSSTQMIDDLQIWLDEPDSNFGWIVIGDENHQKSVKRFDTRENSDPGKRPALEVVYQVEAGPTIFNWIGTGSGGSFHEPNNWDVGTAPSDPIDIVNLINNDPNFDQRARVSSHVAVGNLTIGGISRTMTLSINAGVTASVGDLALSGSQAGLEIELAPGSAGQLSGSGPAALAGTVSFHAPGSPPTSGESFQIVSYASRAGRFNTIVDYAIDPEYSMSLHYNDSRVLAIAGEWPASSEYLNGEFDVPDNLLVSGAWDWNGVLVKRGDGELILDLNGGFSADANAALAIVEGTVRLRGTGQTINLTGLTYGELGALSSISSLAGLYGWYGSVTAVPEPSVLVLAFVALNLSRNRRR
jgi:spore coat protein A